MRSVAGRLLLGTTISGVWSFCGEVVCTKEMEMAAERSRSSWRAADRKRIPMYVFIECGACLVLVVVLATLSFAVYAVGIILKEGITILSRRVGLHWMMLLRRLI
jgi:hypothetical protein